MLETLTRAKEMLIRNKLPGFYQLLFKEELASGFMKPIDQFPIGDGFARVLQGRDSLWVIFEMSNKIGFALRTAFTSGKIKNTIKSGDGQYHVDTSHALFEIDVSQLNGFDTALRATVKMTPTDNSQLPFWPRDLFPLSGGDFKNVEGHMEAAQRGVNVGMCYFDITGPDDDGSVLYVQNLTALNDYFIDTKTKPDSVVGGEWPSIGYEIPTRPFDLRSPRGKLRKGHTYTVSDALITYQVHAERKEKRNALQFLEMMATLYPYLDKPEPQTQNWGDRAQRTLQDLAAAPDATIEHYGHRYIHPYTGAEYPDSMVQLTVVASMLKYAAATHQNIPLVEELRAGIHKFFDPELGTIRRYLPNVGDDKDEDAVDSWYLYHPLMNLGRLADAGDEEAKEFFLGSLEFAIKSAKHFNYKFPIQYNVKTFDVICQSRKDDEWGQTDANGLYAYVMLQAHHLTGEERYLQEARVAIDATKGCRFELAYQTNLTAWGVVACAKLAELDQDNGWLDHSYVFLASLLHNCELWDSKIENAKHFANFFGVTCLHDAPYMAMFETFEIYEALNEYIDVCGDKIAPSARLLVEEFLRYAPDNAWYYYPDTLPADVLATQIRESNGHIDPTLSFPLEDIYGDGQPAGQVGQEIYGAGAAFIFAARAADASAGRVAVPHPRKVDFAPS